jgi:hypothetical protein
LQLDDPRGACQAFEKEGFDTLKHVDLFKIHLIQILKKITPLDLSHIGQLISRI